MGELRRTKEKGELWEKKGEKKEGSKEINNRICKNVKYSSKPTNKRECPSPNEYCKFAITPNTNPIYVEINCTMYRNVTCYFLDSVVLLV